MKCQVPTTYKHLHNNEFNRVLREDNINIICRIILNSKQKKVCFFKFVERK